MGLVCFLSRVENPVDTLCGELPGVESEQCSGVPPEPWLLIFFFCCVSMNDLGPLVKYTCLVITKS